MTIDIEATKTKEIFVQAELYRCLMREIESHRYMIKETGPARRDVLIEASIKKKQEVKNADIVLMWNEKGTSNPLLVIELKKRTIVSPTKSGKKALNQAYEYAKQVGCNLYAIYDGNTFILMQMNYPFLIGVDRFDIFDSESRASSFANNIWDVTLKHWKNTAEGPVEPFDNYSVFLHWKSALRIFVALCEKSMK